MEGMFSNSNLQNIYVGPNWITANATMTGIFEESNISSVTTGMCDSLEGENA